MDGEFAIIPGICESGDWSQPAQARGSAHLQILEGKKEDVYRLEYDSSLVIMSRFGGATIVGGGVRSSSIEGNPTRRVWT